MSSNLWKPKVQVCPACGSSELRPALVIKYWREYPLEFEECGVCGCTFANPMPSEALISRGNDALVRLYQRGRTFEHEFRDARQAYLRGRIFARKLRKITRRGCLLEIGCYDGFFLAGVRDHCDWDVEGVEIALSPSSFARERLGLRVHHGTLESLMSWGGLARYDYFLASDLIEHINRPEEFLRALSKLARPGSRLEIITPNARQDLAFAKRAHQAGTPLSQVLNHVIYYSPRALTRALQGAGFRVREMYCYDIRHAVKDFGLFGLGKPHNVSAGIALEEVENEPLRDLRAEWSEERLQSLRVHPKTGAFYGFYRESLPKAIRLKIPARLELGHEIFCVAERVSN